MTKIIDSLNWRYATKDFDETKKISQADLDEIIEAFRLSPSSFGLEPWKLLIIENPETRLKLQTQSWNQSQITKASHLLVFTRIKNLDDKYIDRFLDNNSKITGATREQLKGYEDMIKGFLGNLNEAEKISWAKEQVYLALGNVTNVLAQKQIDSCIIGGFNSSKYDEILDLDDKGIAIVIVLTIGYRSENDKNAFRKKVRFDKKDICEFIK